MKLSGQKSLARRFNPEADSVPNPNINNDADGDSPTAANNIRVLRPTSSNPESQANFLRQRVEKRDDSPAGEKQAGDAATKSTEQEDSPSPEPADKSTGGHITFSPETYNKPPRDRALRIPGPREFERGKYLALVNRGTCAFYPESLISDTGQRVEEVDADNDGIEQSFDLYTSTLADSCIRRTYESSVSRRRFSCGTFIKS